jgi:hypothetical protein
MEAISYIPTEENEEASEEDKAAKVGSMPFIAM